MALALALLTLGCASSRYVGSLTGGHTYVNRGFGLVVSLGDLAARWWIFDPEQPDRGPAGLAAARREERLDLDGDGLLRLDELTARYEPTLRLLSRTSTSARIEVNVEILSAPASGRVTLRGLFDTEVRARAANPTASRLAIESAEARSLRLGRSALVTSIVGVRGGGAERLALVDQPDFAAEEGAVRRQIVRVRLRAPVLRPEWVADHDLLLQSLLAAPKAGAETRNERW